MPSEEVMHKFKHGKLHSGSKKGPIVKSREQAKAIAASEAREEKGESGRSRRSKLREKRGREKRLEGAKL